MLLALVWRKIFTKDISKDYLVYKNRKFPKFRMGQLPKVWKMHMAYMDEP